MKLPLIFLAIIFLSNLVGMYFGMYLTWWFDMIHHFLGGFFVAMLMRYYLKSAITGDKLKNALIVIGATIFIGVMWEFAEYIASQTLIEPIYNNLGVKAYFIGDFDDTINDLLMDILGALAFVGSYFLQRFYAQKIESPF